MVLPTSNLYQGGTTVTAGTINVTNAGALSSGTVTMAGGKLSLQASASKQQALAVTGFNQDVIWANSEANPTAGTTVGLDGPNGNVLTVIVATPFTTGTVPSSVGPL